jgi:hypothetical protein
MWSLSLSKCGRQFVINPTNKTVSDETKQLIDKLLLERISWRGIARVTGVIWSWLQNYVNVSTSLDVDPERSRRVNNKLAAVPRQIKVSDKPKGKLVIECDEMLTRSAELTAEAWEKPKGGLLFFLRR